MSSPFALIIWRELGKQVAETLQGLNRLEEQSTGPRAAMIRQAIHALEDVEQEFS